MITGKPVDKFRTDSPGPGYYNEEPNNIKDKSPSYRMSPVRRADIINKELAADRPGPGTYDGDKLRKTHSAMITGKPVDH